MGITDWLIVAISWPLWTIAGALIGQARDQQLRGAVLGFLLGPIGAVVAMFDRGGPTPDEYIEQTRRRLNPQAPVSTETGAGRGHDGSPRIS